MNDPAMSQERKRLTNLSRRRFLKNAISNGVTAPLVASLWLSGCKSRQHHKNPNIILIVLDTTRFDRLGCNGYHRPTSPNIDKLAQQALLYTQTIAPSSWTLPSHASLFTGKYTYSHGAEYDPQGPLLLLDAIPGPQSWDKYRARGLPQTETTMAEILKQQGYNTAAVVGGPWLKKIFGLAKGFDFYDDSEIGSLNGRLASQVTASASRWLAESRSERFFLFLNYFDPHLPYMPPEGFAETFLPKGVTPAQAELSTEGINALYDAEILYMDHYVGQLLQKLKSLNLYEKSLIVVTSDHGELLGEHDKFLHGKYLYQQELHVPLIVKYPSGEMAAGRTDLRIQLVDVLPMLCNRLGIDVPPQVQGNVPPQIHHPIIAETYPPPMLSEDGHWRAIFDQDYKFTWNSKGNHLLFNLKDDPGENTNLIERQPQQAVMMVKQLGGFLASLPKPGTAGPIQEIDQQTRDALKSLGYVK